MSVFEAPQCLISMDPASGKLRLEDHVTVQLMSVNRPLHSVAITGLYRTGKSYLLTRIAGKSKGFPLGSSIQSKTKGIWAWCLDHPVREDETLLLLDTEGLGDIRKGDSNNDYQIFTLATLLSSTLIYNTFGAFDDDVLNKLNFITEMSNNIKSSDANISEAGDIDFDLYFPEFILTLRDFTLDLVVDGNEISPDEYLEYCLKAKEGDSKEVQSFNEPRLCIRKYFKKRKCFVFERPTNRRNLKNLEEMRDSDLNEDFVEDTKLFIDYVHNQTAPMKLNNGIPVTGRMFCTMARSYIDAIGEGAIPCIQSALRSMAIIENESAVQEAMSIYCNEMSTNIKLPTQTEQELRDVHLSSKDVAFDHFLKNRVSDDDDTYKLKLDEYVDVEYSKFVSKNEDQSRERCENTLRSLHAKISSRINDGVYAVAGGYKLYKRDREELKEAYDQTDGLGVMQDEAYLRYLQMTENESEAVLKADHTIAEKEKALIFQRDDQSQQMTVSKSNEVERENTIRAEEREALVQKKIEEANKEKADMKAQFDGELEKIRAIQAQELANAKARLDEIAEKRIQESERLQRESLREVQVMYDQQIKMQQEYQRQRERDLQNDRDKMFQQIVEMRAAIAANDIRHIERRMDQQNEKKSCVIS